MSFSTYSGLQAAVADELNRTDLTTQIVDFITLLEADLIPRLRPEITFLPVALDTTLLQAAPDIYLYGTLVHSASFLEHDEREEQWRTKYEHALARHNEYVRTQAQGNAITTYAELLAAVISYLPGNLTNRAPQFVNLCEATLKRRLRRVAAREAIVLTAASPSFDLTALTVACAEIRALHLTTTQAFRNRPMQQMTPSMLAERASFHESTGQPKYYAMVANEIMLAPVPDADYDAELKYFVQYVPVTQSTTQLVASPDLYLYGSLLQAAPYIGNDERVPLWGQAFEAALGELNQQRKMEEFSAAPMPVALPVTFG